MAEAFTGGSIGHDDEWVGGRYIPGPVVSHARPRVPCTAVCPFTGKKHSCTSIDFYSASSFSFSPPPLPMRRLCRAAAAAATQ